MLNVNIFRIFENTDFLNIVEFKPGVVEYIYFDFKKRKKFQQKN